ncbi:MAG: hypothetical protein LBL84_03710, partial [Candidatus Nomurabacteria bacterium]|nr:hypothetical protein [Candidatus Nomurabacteria bacterium]
MPVPGLLALKGDIMTDITVTNIKAAADWIGATALEPLANVTKYEEPTVCEKEHAWVYSPGLFKPISARRLKKLLESVPPLFDFGDFYVAFFPDWERPNPYDYPTWFIDFLAVYKKHMPRSYDPEPGLCKGVTLWRYATTPIFGAQMEMARRPIRGSFITKETKVPVGH